MRNRMQFFGKLSAILAGTSIVFLTSWTTTAASDTWTPVVSKLRRTVTQIASDGSETVTESWEGKYLRDFDGSELRTIKRITPEEDEPAQTGIFTDRANQKAYALVFPTMTAVVKQRSLGGRQDPSVARERAHSQGREEKVFEGLPCFVMPVETHETEGSTYSGSGCYSTEYDLHLYQVLDLTFEETGLTIRTVTELYDLELGIAPKVDSVKLPDGFVIQDGFCPTCSPE